MDMSSQYKVAELKPETIEQIYKAEQELRRETGSEIILIAYQKIAKKS